MDLTKVTRTASIALLRVKHHSPSLFFIAGVASVGASVVLASKATLELEKVVTPHINQLDDIAAAAKDPEIQQYDESKAVKDRMYVMMSLTVDLAKLYGPAVVAGGLGVACLVNSHNILQKRNAALTAAYVGLERSFNAYRERVRKEIGEEKEAELHYNTQREVATKYGQESPGFTAVGDTSIYGRWYNSQTTTEWKANRYDNLGFLELQQQYANDRLHRRGYLFLNEVLESLGMQVCDYGQVVGWTMYGDGDQVVDFGVFKHGGGLKDGMYLAGINEEIYLDFNVDGQVAEKLGF